MDENVRPEAEGSHSPPMRSIFVVPFKNAGVVCFMLCGQRIAHLEEADFVFSKSAVFSGHV